MYFYKKNGKQHLDLKGDLIITHNDALIKTRSKSAGPRKATNAKYILAGKLTFIQKIEACFKVIGFIFGKQEPLNGGDKNAD